MTTNTVAFQVVNPNPAKKQEALVPEQAPTFLWGQGTPDGDREPFLSAQKGTLYFQVDATDDTGHIWTKVDEGNDDADWVLGGTTNSILNYAISKEFNIDNGSGTTDDDIIIVPDQAITLVSAYVFYTEATDTAGVASANIKLGTAVGGNQLVTATALQVSKAVGAKTSLTLSGTSVSANGMVAARHTGIAATEAGKYKVVISYTIP